MTITQLRDALNDLIEQGAGDAKVVIEEQGVGYVGDLLNVDTWMVSAEFGDTVTLLGSEREELS